ncbi:hypothetical protein NRF20_29540 [Streptomyces sp. R-74717]|uniref:hypothetical protein n=1 Tax=Streptomyces sp. R-74717 TaxID=2969820 RepID=UPI0039B3A939
MKPAAPTARDRHHAADGRIFVVPNADACSRERRSAEVRRRRRTLWLATRDVVLIAWGRPLADVLAAMFHQAALPVAESLFDGEGDVLELLRDPSVREGFLGRA